MCDENGISGTPLISLVPARFKEALGNEIVAEVAQWAKSELDLYAKEKIRKYKKSLGKHVFSLYVTSFLWFLLYFPSFL